MRSSAGAAGGGKQSGAAVGTSQDNQIVKPKTENFQNERDKFLKDFEKPTQIYRFLRTRMLYSPLFLYRNLNYMRNRMSRSHKSRKDFKINELKAQVEAKHAEEEKAKLIVSKKMCKNFLNLIILGFWDGQNWLPDTEAKIELQIIRICVKKRKDSRIPISKAFSGSCSIKMKSPTESVYKEEFSIPIGKGKYPVMVVPKDCFTLVNGHVVESLRLVVRVTIPTSGLAKDEISNKRKDSSEINESDSKNNATRSGNLLNGRLSTPGNCVNSRKSNNNNNHLDAIDESPKPKRQRSLQAKDRENLDYDQQNNKQGGNKGDSATSQSIVYTGLLTIYDKANNINIPAQGNADVEFRLNRQESRKPGISVKKITREGTWETEIQPDHSKIQEYLLLNGTTGCVAKLAIAIRASNEKMGPTVATVSPLSLQIKDTKDEEEKQNRKENIRVVYQFGSSPGQMTESHNDLRCPWCSIDCLVLYSLLKHLKNCHPRFRFTFSPIANGARVDVSINESYDGSYSGSAYDLVSQPPGQAFARNGPAKRTQVFSMLTFRPPPLKRSLQEFFDSEEKNGEQRRSYMTGHNRLYHHTTTCLPIHPREIDVDSEGEPDPEWLRVKTCMMIDEFTDVNEGEKEIMKMWNHHVMHDNYVGDCQIPLACKRFVDRYGKEIIEKNLYRNFILHLTNLYDFGLLPANGFHNTVQSLHTQMKENNTAPLLRDAWKLMSKKQIDASNDCQDEPMDVDEQLPTPTRHSNGTTATASHSHNNGSDKNGQKL